MSKNSGRSVFHIPGKGWADQRNGASKPAGIHPTQKSAYDSARDHMRNQGGGEVTIMRKDNGQIRDKNTISPGNDPFPPKG